MSRGTELLALLGLLAAASARADQCEALVAKLTAVDGVRYDHASPSGKNHFLAAAPASEISVDCGTASPTLYIYYEGAFPSREFFALGGRLGSIVLGQPARDIEAAMRGCQQIALKDTSELADVHRAGLSVECQAATRDGGVAGFTIYAAR